MNDTKIEVPEGFTNKYACRSCNACVSITVAAVGFLVECTNAGGFISAVLRKDLAEGSRNNCPNRGDTLKSHELKLLNAMAVLLPRSGDLEFRGQQIRQLEVDLRQARLSPQSQAA